MPSRPVRNALRSRLLMESLEDRLAPATFTVTNENSAGPGSLRAAINAANAAPGADRIGFNIPGSAVHRIELLSALPAITDTLTINGASQPGFNGKPRIVLNGSSAGASANGLVVRADGSLIRSLVINEFGNDGIRIRAADCRVIGSYIGTGAAGLGALGNGGAGVRIFAGATNVVIGGTDAASGNVIVGNGLGVFITGDGTDNNRVEGNLIGINAAGTAAMANITGMWIAEGASGNVIGGAAGNVISGNDDLGVFIADAGTLGNSVVGNRIGTNIDGTAAIGNGATAISIHDAAASTLVADNLISGNGGNGVTLGGAGITDCIVRGNIIGLNAAGTSALPNALNGIVVEDGAHDNTIGGTTAADRNAISGNFQNGIHISGPGTTANVILGNFIGMDVTGAADLGNAINGVLISDGASNNVIGGTIGTAKNLISGNDSDGIEINGAGTNGNTILGNFVGTDVTGTLDLGNLNGVFVTGGATDTMIGGTEPGARNVISGNGRNLHGRENNGILVEGLGTTGTIIQGNFIGTDVTGTLDLGNGNHGVRTIDAANTLIGGTAPGARNIISGNDWDGVFVEGTGTAGTMVQGNYVGLDVTGTAKLGNHLSGVTTFRTTGVLVGGTEPGAGNVVSGNGNTFLGSVQGSGVLLEGPNSSRNVVQGNLIGTDATGTIALGNVVFGLWVFDGSSNNLIGGSTPGAGNVIAASGMDDVSVWDVGTDGNVFKGNLIGTDRTGTVALSGVPGPIGGFGVLIGGGASNNVLGGTADGERNVISGHRGAGVVLGLSGGSGNVLQGNFIGTDVTGTLGLGNGGGGVQILSANNVIGGLSPGAGNVISGNGAGVSISGLGSSGNVLQGNFVGTDVNGNDLGNEGAGISIIHDAADNRIGGSEPGAGNVIAYNGDSGVKIGNDPSPFNQPAGSGNSVLGNTIFNNGGLGIDLGVFGNVTPNDPDDADTGPNDLLNFPVLASAVLGGGDVLVTGTINTEKFKTLRIEFFTNTEADPSGHGEGEIFIGFLDVEMGDNNTVNFEVLLQGSEVEPGQVITATATDELGNTSEFSLAIAVS